MSAKTYNQFCPVAVSLDLLGDRWTLLILRDLTFGPQRFSDLRRSLDGIAPNLLSERLRELEAEGLVGREELPPPAARSVYVLTEEGQSVRPVLRALLRFGLDRLPDDPEAVVQPRVAVAALLASADDARADRAGDAGVDGSDVEVEVVIDEMRVRRHITGGVVGRGDRSRPVDVTMEGSARVVLDLARKRLTWSEATEQGVLTLTGNVRARRQVRDAFGLVPDRRSKRPAATATATAAT